MSKQKGMILLSIGKFTIAKCHINTMKIIKSF